METTNIIDVIRASGSLDMFFYPIHLFTNYIDLAVEDSHKLIKEILELLNIIIAHYGEDNDI